MISFTDHFPGAGRRAAAAAETGDSARVVRSALVARSRA